MADRENCVWARTTFKPFDSMRVRISEGRTILISLGEPRFINQRGQIGLKSTLYGERCITPSIPGSPSFLACVEKIGETGDKASYDVQ